MRVLNYKQETIFESYGNLIRTFNEIEEQHVALSSVDFRAEMVHASYHGDIAIRDQKFNYESLWSPSYWTKVVFSNCRFDNKSFSQAIFTDVRFNLCSFSNTLGGTFIRCSFSQCDIQNLQLNKIKHIDCDWTGAYRRKNLPKGYEVDPASGGWSLRKKQSIRA